MKKIKAMKSVWMAVVGAAALAWSGTSAQGQSPVIASFGSNGELVCTNLLAGSTASVVWASSLLGPWTNSAPGLDAVTADTNGAIRVSVPVLSWSGKMFCRVWGVPAPTNPPAPAGMVLIPAGPFVMGDTLDGSSSSLPLHTNTLSAFCMNKFHVTKALWDEVRTWALTNGYSFENVGSGKATNHPVHTVNWWDCVKWCNARSEKEGLVPAYYTSAAQTTAYRTGRVAVQNDWVKWNNGYRLPTEAEWEKAARGGTSGQRFPWGDTISWTNANYNARPLSAGGYDYDVNPTEGYNPTFNDGVYPYTSPVGYFPPNRYGLYDMAGTLQEWCWDFYGSYSSASQTDPRGPSSGSFRVVRNGSWFNVAIDCRAASRNYDVPMDRNGYLGFRSVLPPGQ